MTDTRQKTLAGTVGFRGTGVHTGRTAEVEIGPAAAGRGIVFYRTELPGREGIPAAAEAVTATGRGTCLGPGERGVRTVEHLLAAFSGMGIDNATVEMNGPELPMGDGSALPWVRLIEAAGVRELEEEQRFSKLKKPVAVESEEGVIAAFPAPELRLACTIAFGDPLLDAQFRELALTPETFVRELAPARTFGFYREALPLLERGLIRGTGLENTVVIGPGAVFSRGGLRFPDECVRHKMLDLIGDLALLGRPFRGLVLAVRPGHGLNVEFVRKLKEALNEPE